MYEKLIGMYQVNNLSQVLALKMQLKDIKMNRGETIQVQFTRISKIKAQLSIFGEVVSDKELVLIMLGGLPSSWESFITTISNNDKFPTFDELLGKCSQEEAKMISRGRIPKHEEGEPTAFVVQGKKKKGRRGMHYSRKSTSNSSSQWTRDLSKVQCFNCHKHGHYAHD